MLPEFAEFIIKHKSAGVIVVSRKIPIEVVIEELLMIWAVSGAEEWVDRIAKIPL
jgi:hypothetical protein